MAFSAVLSSLFSWLRKNSLRAVSLVGGSACVAPFQLTVKILVKKLSSTVNMLKKSNRSLIMFPSGSRHSSDVKVGLRLSLKWPRLRLCQLSIKAS